MTKNFTERRTVSQVVTPRLLLCITKQRKTDVKPQKTYDHGNRLQNQMPALQHGVQLQRRSIVRHAAALRRVRELRRDGAADTLPGMPQTAKHVAGGVRPTGADRHDVGLKNVHGISVFGEICVTLGLL